jgi:hypothetical protein
MTFVEIFEKFKNHSYIRRESWSEDVFIQLRNTTALIRLVMFATADTSKTKSIKSINTLNNDVRLSAEDLIADDWIDIDNYKRPKEPVKPTTLWEYVDTLEDGSDEWRKAIDLGSKYHKAGKNPDEYLEEIIKKVKHFKN